MKNISGIKGLLDLLLSNYKELKGLHEEMELSLDDELADMSCQEYEILKEMYIYAKRLQSKLFYAREGKNE